MGCDIHAHLEVKLGGKWEHYTIPDINRDYQLFERMAGVRGDVEAAIIPPRGMPVDPSVVTAFDAELWSDDAHSYSWLSAVELAELCEWQERRCAKTGFISVETDWRCYLFGSSLASFTRYPDERPAGIEDVRIVFWFDN